MTQLQLRKWPHSFETGDSTSAEKMAPFILHWWLNFSWENGPIHFTLVTQLQLRKWTHSFDTGDSTSAETWCYRQCWWDVDMTKALWPNYWKYLKILCTTKKFIMYILSSLSMSECIFTSRMTTTFYMSVWNREGNALSLDLSPTTVGNIYFPYPHPMHYYGCLRLGSYGHQTCD